MFTTFTRLITLISLFFITACSHSLRYVQPNELGVIYDLHRGQTLSPSDFVKQLASAERLLIGEQHDNLKHHQAQFWLLQQLHQHRPQRSLVLEMLRVDQQPLIADLSPNDTACLSCLAEKLRWQKGWNWSFYGETVQAALMQKTHLVAANLTREEVDTLMQGAEPLKGFRSTEAAVKRQLATLIATQHGMTSGENGEMIRKMVEVQQFRDRRMAEKVLQATLPVLLIAGNHHINRQFGVPLHLTDLAPTRPVINVLLGDNPSGYTAQHADYFWLLK